MCVHSSKVGSVVDWTEATSKFTHPSQQVQEELIPSKAPEAEVGVVSGAEKNSVKTLPVSPKALCICHVYLSRLSQSLVETI